MRAKLAFYKGCFLFSLLATIVFTGQSHATDIQMLPPTYLNTASSCAGYNAVTNPYNQILMYSGDSVSGHGGINCVPSFAFDNNGNINTGFTINQGWSQALTINSNQIWKSVTTGDPNLYFQWSTPGGGVIIGGQGGATNNLSVNGSTTIRDSVSVGGTISLGNAGVGGSCSPQGAIAFDRGANIPVYCNGATWQSMQGGHSAFGGTYVNNLTVTPWGNLPETCWIGNDQTGGCSCPAGTSSHFGTMGVIANAGGISIMMKMYTCY